jgi:hypothetical protein
MVETDLDRRGWWIECDNRIETSRSDPADVITLSSMVSSPKVASRPYVFQYSKHHALGLLLLLTYEDSI